MSQTRALSLDEHRLVERMLQGAELGSSDFASQLRRARVGSVCPCGCASVGFTIEGAQPRHGPIRLMAEYLYGPPESPLGVFLYERAGVLAGLEVWNPQGGAAPRNLPVNDELRRVGATRLAAGAPSRAMPGRMAPGRAAALGLLFVNGPAAVFLLGLPALVNSLYPDQPVVGAGSALVGFVLAWLTWAFTAPRWRLWAHARVDDLRELQLQAQKLGIVWPPGSFLEKTEFRWADYDVDLLRARTHRGDVSDRTSKEIKQAAAS